MKPIEEQTYFELLELPPSATAADVDLAYQRALAFYGPDSVATYALVDPDEVQRMVERLEEAYQTLSDPARRERYEAALQVAPSPAGEPEAAAATEPPAEVATPLPEPGAPLAAPGLSPGESLFTRAADAGALSVGSGAGPLDLSTAASPRWRPSAPTGPALLDAGAGLAQAPAPHEGPGARVDGAPSLAEASVPDIHFTHPPLLADGDAGRGPPEPAPEGDGAPATVSAAASPGLEARDSGLAAAVGDGVPGALERPAAPGSPAPSPWGEAGRAPEPSEPGAALAVGSRGEEPVASAPPASSATDSPSEPEVLPAVPPGPPAAAPEIAADAALNASQLAFSGILAAANAYSWPSPRLQGPGSATEAARAGEASASAPSAPVEIAPMPRGTAAAASVRLAIASAPASGEPTPEPPRPPAAASHPAAREAGGGRAGLARVQALPEPSRPAPSASHAATRAEGRAPLAAVPEPGRPPGAPAERHARGDEQEPRAAAPAPAAAARPPAKPIEIGPGSVFNGELLRRVRESRGVTLRELSDKTRIGVGHLENVEADRYEALPVAVYLRGFLMSVARELKLDPLKVAKSYLDLAAQARAPKT